MMRAAFLLFVAASTIVFADAQAAEQERFDIQEYRVLGNTVLPATDVERAVYPHLGEDRSIADAEAARVALERAYRDAGYATVFVDIPEQEVADGIVRLKVTEGRLDRVRVTGARYFSQRRILARLPGAERDRVPHLPSFQSELNALNRQIADRRITPVLKSGRAPGTVDLELKVEDSPPVHGSLEVNDRYTADTSRLRVSAGLTYGNLFERRHALGLSYQLSPEEPDEVKVLSGTYTIPWGDHGHSFVLSAIRSDTDVAALGTLGVLGRGKIFGLRSVWSLPHGDWFHAISAGVDYKDVAEIIRPRLSGGAAGDEVDRPVDYLSWSLTHNAFRRGDRFSFASTLGAYFGTRRLANDDPEFNLKRSAAPPNFFYLRGTMQLDLRLWRGFVLGSRLSGQYADMPLISNEQLGIGGVDTVRGYLEADQFGDSGVAGTLELRTPSLLGSFPNGSLIALAFGDAGVVRLDDVLGGQARRFDLSSYGFGLRFAGFDGLEAGIDWARPLVPSTRIEAEDDRVHFTFRYAF
jgi:hemolysin activation/secretion protein